MSNTQKQLALAKAAKKSVNTADLHAKTPRPGPDGFERADELQIHRTRHGTGQGIIRIQMSDIVD